MADQFSRTCLLLGPESMKKLAASRVCIFGVGGVGGYVAEALARCGVGHLDLVDNDRICETNLNRQIIALHSTLGRYKAEVMRERILDINPAANVTAHLCFYLPETQDRFDFSKYDYVVDAIDTIAGKIALVTQAEEAHTPIISSMGAGNKLDPGAFRVADISRTSVCPLARVMRQELRKRKIVKLKVVYSEEKPIPVYMADPKEEEVTRRRSVPGSCSFVPSAAGLIIAGEVVKDLIRADKKSYDVEKMS